MADSLRDAVTAAFEADESPDDPVVSDTTTETPAPEEATGAPADTSTEPSPSDQPSGERQRDSLGRFIPASQADGKGQVATPGEKAPVGLPAQSQTPSWTPPTYEKPPVGIPVPLKAHWSALTPEWRQYVHEAMEQRQQFDQQVRPSIQFAQRFMQTVEPYRDTIQLVAGGDPLAAVNNLLNYDARLRNGTPAEKAAAAAFIVKNYNIDIEALDQALVGAVPQNTGATDPMAIQRAVQQALSPLLSAAQQRQAERAQRTEAETAREIDAFKADPKNEYFEDVRNLMADVMEVSTRNGEELSIADAYERACLLHPDVRKIIVAQQNGASAQSLTQAAQRAKAAAVSVKGSGAVVGSPEPTEPLSVRAAIERAIETHSGRV